MDRKTAATNRTRPLARSIAINRANRTVLPPSQRRGWNPPRHDAPYSSLRRTDGGHPRQKQRASMSHAQPGLARKYKVAGVMARFPVMALEFGIQVLFRGPTHVQIGDQPPALRHVEHA